jgi:hypothetical protein
MKKIGIYKITNPKGKIYVGQSINIEDRWKMYKRLKCKKQPKLYNSLKKHGPENHLFEIIEECTLEQLTLKEINYKKDMVNEIGWKNVLFCDIYDRGIGGLRSISTRQKISKGNTGKKRSEEYKLNISLKNKGRKQSKETIEKRALKNTGKKRSEETKQKISISNTGKKRSEETKNKLSLRDCYLDFERSKKIKENRNHKNIGKKLSKIVLQIDPNTLQTIKEWISRTEIYNSGLKGIVGAISRQKIYKGYIWKYKN